MSDADMDILLINNDDNFASTSLESNADNMIPHPATPRCQKPKIQIHEDIQLTRPNQQPTSAERGHTSLIITPYTNTRRETPAMINNAPVTDLSKLRPTRTIEEYEMRASNSVQRFTTREGVDIFIPKSILNRIDWRAIQATKKKIKTINLPDRYQAQVKVRADGQIIFRQYHKRGIQRIKARLNQQVQLGGGCSTRP